MKHIRLIDIITNEIAPLAPTDTIQDGLNLMSSSSISSVVVADEQNRPLGIFTENDTLKIISQHYDKSMQLQEVMTQNVFCLDASLNLHDAYILLEQKGYRHLIVVDAEGTYIGVVSEGDFLRNLGFEDAFQSKAVEDVMQEAPLMVKENSLIVTAAKMMNENKTSFVIVVDDMNPVGILSEKEITHFLANKNIESKETIESLDYLSAILIRPVISLKEASAMMKSHGVHQLIVVNEENRMIGILDRHDVLKAIHGAYFNYLINVIDKKNDTLLELEASKELLATTSALLNNVINTIPDLICLKDTHGIYLKCNHVFERFFGAKESEIVGKSDFDFVDQELAEFFRKNDKKAIENGGPSGNEEYLKFADGSYEGLFYAMKTPLKDEENNIIGVLGIAHDITKHRADEDNLKQIDDALNEAQAMAHVGSWQLNIQENSFTASDEGCRIFGLNPKTEKISAQTIRALIHPDDLAEFIRKHDEGVLEGKYNHIYRIVVDGKIKWIHAFSSSVTDESGTFKKMKGILKDITKQKLYEEQLEKLANYDSLTGLANRELLLSHLRKSIQNATKNNQSLALLHFDLDDFKNINDSFGHNIGDEILKMATERLSEHIGITDFIARIGGDEFAIILEDVANSEDVSKFAQEMIDIMPLKIKTTFLKI